MNEVVDAILIPHVDELQYAIPSHTNVKVYEIWLRYRFDLVRNNGDEIASWTMTSYGKTPTAFMRSDTDAVNLAAVMALRDAGANFITNFARVPDVRNWLEQRAKTRKQVGALSPADVPQAPGKRPAAISGATTSPAVEAEDIPLSKTAVGSKEAQ